MERKENGLEKLLQNKPVFCKKCRGRLKYMGGGVYRCEDCDHEELDDFGRIKLFLDENGPASAIVISKATGVDREVIDMYLRKGRMEIPDGSKYYLKCEKCGCEIKYGRVCPECAKEMNGTLNLLRDEIGEKPKFGGNSEMKGKMHYLNKR